MSHRQTPEWQTQPHIVALQQELSDALTTVMHGQKLLPKDVAAQSGMTTHQVNNILQLKANPRLSTLSRIQHGVEFPFIRFGVPDNSSFSSADYESMIDCIYMLNMLLQGIEYFMSAGMSDAEREDFLQLVIKVRMMLVTKHLTIDDLRKSSDIIVGHA